MACAWPAGRIGAGTGHFGMVDGTIRIDGGSSSRQERNTPLHLTTYLSMAMVTYSLLFWTALDMFCYAQPIVQDNIRYLSRIRIPGIALTALTEITIVSGAFVAGNDAGRTYNKFPKMYDKWFLVRLFYSTRFPRRSPRSDLAPLVREYRHDAIQSSPGGSLTARTGTSLALYGLHRFPTTVSALAQSLLALVGHSDGFAGYRSGNKSVRRGCYHLTDLRPRFSGDLASTGKHHGPNQFQVSVAQRPNGIQVLAPGDPCHECATCGGRHSFLRAMIR
jgi:Cytochrome oxidase assembly protein